NVLALLREHWGHLRGLDLSHLAIRGASLQGVEMQDANLSGALLRECVFSETFDAIWGVAISRSGQYWAAGSQRGEVRVWREAGQILHLVWQAHTDSVTSLAFSPVRSSRWPGVRMGACLPVATSRARFGCGKRARPGRLAACRRSGGIATGCGDWPLPPMAAGSPARAGMAPSSSGRSGRREADAVSRRWWGIRRRCIAWPGARMEARWPVAALTTRSGCGMARRAALGRRYWDIPPWCTAWPSPPTAAACSVAVAMVRCGCGTWSVASRYASCRATGPPSSTSTGVRTGLHRPP